MGPISEDIIVYNRRGLVEKLEIINSLYHKALESMEDPKSAMPKLPKSFEEEGIKEWPSFVKDLGIDLGSTENGRNFYIALKNQDYTCLLCGIGVNPKYEQQTKVKVASDVLKLKPHRIVHKRFLKLFSWGSVPGKDSERLLMSLRDDFNIGWVENAEILKSDDGKTIRIFKDENSAEIMIDEKMGKATLKMGDDRTHNLQVKKERGKLNIYYFFSRQKVDYVLENIAILCPDCHKKESEIFKRCLDTFFKDWKVREWKKLIHLSFNFFKTFITAYSVY